MQHTTTMPDTVHTVQCAVISCQQVQVRHASSFMINYEWPQKHKDGRTAVRSVSCLLLLCDSVYTWNRTASNPTGTALLTILGMVSWH